MKLIKKNKIKLRIKSGDIIGYTKNRADQKGQSKSNIKQNKIMKIQDVLL